MLLYGELVLRFASFKGLPARLTLSLRLSRLVAREELGRPVAEALPVLAEACPLSLGILRRSRTFQFGRFYPAFQCEVLWACFVFVCAGGWLTPRLPPPGLLRALVLVHGEEVRGRVGAELVLPSEVLLERFFKLFS